MNKELEENIEIVKELLEGAKSNNIYEENKYFKSIEKLLNYIDNSIPREIIEEKLEKYKQQLKNNTKRVVQLQVLEQNGGLQQSEWEELNTLFGDIEKIRGKIEALEELLKKN